MEKNGSFSSIEGFFTFVSHPRLWMVPLFFAFLSLVIFLVLFIGSAIFFWPHSDIYGWYYFWLAVKAIGYGALLSLLSWTLAVPLLLSSAFDKMIRKAFVYDKIRFKEGNQVAQLVTSVHVVLKTLGWRLFWPLLTLFSLFLFPLLTVFISQVGLGHTAVIDGSGIALSVFDFSAEEQARFFQKHTRELLFMGIVAGSGSFILMPTFLGWLFWLPGIYLGAALWIAREKR